MPAAGKIAVLLNSVKGLKADYKTNFKEDAKQDWKFDFDALAGAAAPVLPANTVLPVITGWVGAPETGELQTVGNGTWTGSATITYTYAWYNSNSPTTVLATTATYTPVPGDVGFGLYAKVTATNAAGSTTVTTATTPAVVL